MVWCWTGDKRLSEPMLGYVADAYMRHSAQWGKGIFLHLKASILSISYTWCYIIKWANCAFYKLHSAPCPPVDQFCLFLLNCNSLKIKWCYQSIPGLHNWLMVLFNCIGYRCLAPTPSRQARRWLIALGYWNIDMVERNKIRRKWRTNDKQYLHLYSCLLMLLFIFLPLFGCQLDEPHGFPGDHQPDATML